MNIRERLEAFWSGERPDEIPYTIYQNEWRHTQNDPAWQPLYAKGLGVTHHAPVFRLIRPNVTVVTREYEENGVPMKRQVYQTPLGEVFQTWQNGWRRMRLLKTPADYRVMRYAVENTKATPQYEAYQAKVKEAGPHGVVLVGVGRTPMQTILIDYAGIEQFPFHFADFEEEVRALYEALLRDFRQRVEIVAKGPGRYVACLENFTAESLGPQRYAEFLLPVYEECFPVLQAAGKVVGCHYDGRTSACKELIARAPIDVIESLTEPNEGDMTLAECRAAWPDKLFWCNIRVGDYQLPPAQLKQKVLDLVRQAAPDGRKLAFEVSEQYPANWKESISVVLDALKETRAP